MQGKRVAVSGSGNVAIYTVEKLLELGAIPLTMSDSTGYIYEPNGITTEILEYVNDLKTVKRGSLSSYKSSNGGGYPLPPSLARSPRPFLFPLCSCTPVQVLELFGFGACSPHSITCCPVGLSPPWGTNGPCLEVPRLLTECRSWAWCLHLRL